MLAFRNSQIIISEFLERFTFIYTTRYSYNTLLPFIAMSTRKGPQLKFCKSHDDNVYLTVPHNFEPEKKTEERTCFSALLRLKYIKLYLIINLAYKKDIIVSNKSLEVGRVLRIRFSSFSCLLILFLKTIKLKIIGKGYNTNFNVISKTRL